MTKTYKTQSRISRTSTFVNCLRDRKGCQSWTDQKRSFFTILMINDSHNSIVMHLFCQLANTFKQVHDLFWVSTPSLFRGKVVDVSLRRYISGPNCLWGLLTTVTTDTHIPSQWWSHVNNPVALKYPVTFKIIEDIHVKYYKHCEITSKYHQSL